MGGRGGGSPATRQAEVPASAPAAPVVTVPTLTSDDQRVLNTISNMLTVRRAGVPLDALRVATTVTGRRSSGDFTEGDLDESLDRLRRAGRVVTTERGLYKIRGMR